MLWEMENGLQLIPYIIALLAIIFLQYLCSFYRKGYTILGRAIILKNLLTLLAIKNIWQILRPAWQETWSSLYWLLEWPVQFYIILFLACWYLSYHGGGGGGGGGGGFSKVVATFNLGGSFNLFMATTGEFWIIPSFWIWGYVLHVEHISCVIINNDQHQWVIPFPLSIAL